MIIVWAFQILFDIVDVDNESISWVQEMDYIVMGKQLQYHEVLKIKT